MGFHITSLLETFRWWDVLDILIVAIGIYYVYKFVKETRAIALAKGLGVLVVINLLAHMANLYVISWLMQQFMTVIIVALPIVFQPELRRFLEKLGRGRIFTKAQSLNDEQMDEVIAEVMGAARVMSRDNIGALMVFEREVPLGDYTSTGTPIDAKLSRELLINIFVPNTPLHDGAVLIRNGRIDVAGSLLPLTADVTLSRELGTRHRAAIGITEQTDAVVLVVSEETGKISYAYGGHIYRHLEDDQIIGALHTLMERPRQSIADMWKWGGGK